MKRILSAILLCAIFFGLTACGEKVTQTAFESQVQSDFVKLASNEIELSNENDTLYITLSENSANSSVDFRLVYGETTDEFALAVGETKKVWISVQRSLLRFMQSNKAKVQSKVLLH